MRKKNRLVALGLALVPALAIGTASLATPRAQDGMKKPFGGEEDVAFAQKTWKAMQGYRDWKLRTDVYRGNSPHGKWVRLFSTWVTVGDKAYPIIIKENFGGRGVTPEAIEKDPDAFLKAVTIMLQRRPGYDPDDHDWFWVKYQPDGSIEKNEMGMALAGRVAKGMPKGCISCHSQAAGGDFLYSNDD